EKLAEIASQCLELSDKLRNDLNEIVENMNTIDESTSKTSQKAGQVNSLLNNIVAFCNNNSSMDSDSVRQMVNILETTINAFSVLDDNVSTTNASTRIINNSIVEIKNLVDDINITLHKTEE
ncbi:MAG: (4Fe-4S)-binding protein, partial [Ruminococcus sp.]